MQDLILLAQCHQGEEANLDTSAISYLGYATTNTTGYLDYLTSFAQLQYMSHCVALLRLDITQADLVPDMRTNEAPRIWITHDAELQDHC